MFVSQNTSILKYKNDLQSEIICYDLTHIINCRGYLLDMFWYVIKCESQKSGAFGFNLGLKHGEQLAFVYNFSRISHLKTH